MTAIAGGAADFVAAAGGGISVGTSTTASQTTGVEGGTGFTIAYPSLAVDDYLALFWGIRAANGTFAFYVNTPSGFTEACTELRDASGDDRMTQFAYKRAVGSESGNLTMKWQNVAGNTATGFAIMVPISGIDWTSGPFDPAVVHATHHISDDNDASPTCVSLTTLENGSEVLHMTCLTGATVTNVSTNIGTEIGKIVQTSSQDISAYMSSINKATAGSQTGATHTYAGGAGASDDYQTMVVGLRAA